MSVRKSMAWAFFGQFTTFAISFVASVVVARLLSPHEMGIYAIAVATLGVVQVIATFGVAAYVVRETELTSQMVDTAFTVNALLAVVLAAVMLAVSFTSDQVFGDANAGRVMRVLALGPLIGIFGFRPQAMLQREMLFKQAAAVGVISILASAVVTIGGARMGYSYMSPAYGAIASSLVSAVGFCLAAPRHVGFRMSFTGARAMSIFGLRMMSISGVAVLTGRLSDVAFGRILGLTNLGLYSRASSIANMIFDNIYATATRVMFTKLAKDFREHGEMRRPFLLAFQIITGLLWPAQVGLAVLSRPLIYLIYGEKWLGAALPLSLLMVSQALILSFGMNWELFVLRNETARQTRIEITRSLMGLVFFIIGCQFGIVGVAGMAVVSALVGAIIYFPYMHRLAETTPGELVAIYGRSGLLALAAAGPSLLLMFATNWSAHTSPALMVAAIAAGGVLWASMIVRLRHPLLNEFRMLVQRFSHEASS